MPSGLRVFDAQGNVLFDSSVNTTRIIGTVSSGTSSGSIVVPEFLSGQGWAVMGKINTDASKFNDVTLGNYPLVQIDGDTLSWTYGSYDIDVRFYAYLDLSQRNLDVEIIYGVYQ